MPEIVSVHAQRRADSTSLEELIEQAGPASGIRREGSSGDIRASLAQERLQTPATEVVRGRSTLRCKSNRTIIRRMGDGEQRQSQLLRGVLDLCLLAVIEEQPAYGYEMTKRLRERGLFIVGEGSIYPLLGRLERDGLVQTHRAPSDGGPPRKYYRTSGKGQRALARGVAEWRAVRDAVDGVLRPIEVEVKR